MDEMKIFTGAQITVYHFIACRISDCCFENTRSQHAYFFCLYSMQTLAEAIKAAKYQLKMFLCLYEFSSRMNKILLLHFFFKLVFFSISVEKGSNLMAKNYIRNSSLPVTNQA